MSMQSETLQLPDAGLLAKEKTSAAENPLLPLVGQLVGDVCYHNARRSFGFFDNP